MLCQRGWKERVYGELKRRGEKEREEKRREKEREEKRGEKRRESGERCFNYERGSDGERGERGDSACPAFTLYQTAYLHF